MTSERTKQVAIERQTEMARDWLDNAKHCERLAIHYAEQKNKENSEHFLDSALKDRLMCCIYALGYLFNVQSTITEGPYKNTFEKRKKDD